MSEETLTPRVEELLSEVVAWLRFQNRAPLIELLREALRENRDWLIYDLTDGCRSQDDIAKAVGVSQPTVLRAWNRWKKLGIVIEVPDITGRCKHLARLGDLGLEGPADEPPRKRGKAHG